MKGSSSDSCVCRKQANRTTKILPASGDNQSFDRKGLGSAGAEITAVPALPLAGIGLLGLLLALLGSRAVVDDRRQLDT